MKMFNRQLFVFIIIYIRDSSCTLDAAYNAGKQVWKLYSIIETMESNFPDAVDRLPADNVVMRDEMKKQMAEINKQLVQMEKSIPSKIVHHAFKSWPDSIMLYKCIDTLEIYIASVDAYYNDFRGHMNETSYPSEKIQIFMGSFVSNVDNSIRMIQSYVLDENPSLPDHRNLIFAITGYAVFLQSQLCNTFQILSHLLVQLFKMVVLAEMKSHVMIAIGRTYQLPKTADRGVLGIYTKERLERQLRSYVDLFSLTIPLVDLLYVRGCDPVDNNWVRGKSFYELEGTYQTAIFHYDYFNCHHDSCNDVRSTKAEQCDPQYYDARSGCSRIITECVYLDAVQACVLEEGARKFQYVQSSTLGLLGTDSKCPKSGGYVIDIGTRYNSTRRVCACKCYENHDRIGLFMMQSHVESNMVITGIRFVRQDQMLYIQPKEGKLDADGSIVQYSERWMHIPEDIPSSQIHSVDEQNKLFFLDDVRLPADFALIGVRFNRVKRGDLIGFAIKIYGAPFDFSSGKLDLDPEYRVSVQPPNGNPREPLTFKAISSVYAHSTHILSPTNKNYVLLRRSEIEKDFGQSTLPLFEAVPITTSPSSVLGGVGIFHKGVKGYAGFISLRIYGVKYAEYFTDFKSTYVPYVMTNDEIRPTY